MQFARELIRLQPSLSSTGIDALPDVPITLETPITYSLANSKAIAASLAGVLAHVRSITGVRPCLVTTLFKNLTQESTASGYLAQLQGYGWLIDQGTSFEPEVAHAATLRGREIDLDGRIDVLAHPVFFEIKSFGFEPDLRATFARRLESKFPGYTFTIDGSGNHGPDAVNAEAFVPLRHHLVTLASAEQLDIPALQWTVRKRKKGPGARFAEHEYDPVALAHENRWVPLQYASQFATDATYILIFVLPDGIGSSLLKINIFGSLRDLANRIATHLFETEVTNAAQASTFDNSLPPTVTVTQAIAHLSGIAFISPQAGFAALHLNRQAAHPLSIEEACRLARGWEIALHGTPRAKG